jgi:hypothetical protein
MDERVRVIVDAIRASVRVATMGRRGEELSVRCPECGDSVKHPDHAHCNIRLTQPDAIVFHCVRCDWDGMVDSAFMRRIGVYDEAANLAAHRNTMSIRRKIGRAARELTGGRSDRLPSPAAVPASSPAALRRLGYLNERLGLALGPHEAASRLRVVADLRDLFRANPWMRPTEERWMMTRLADQGIGFLSADRTHIVFRDTTDTWSRRYFNYKVHGMDVPGASKMYFATSRVDRLAPRLNLSMTEGIFDALAVAYHQEPGSMDRGDTIVASANGKGFPWLIKSVRRMGFLDLNVRIYSDSDVPVGVYRWILTGDPLLDARNFEVLYNDCGASGGGKTDFGVPPDRVKVRRASISKYENDR